MLGETQSNEGAMYFEPTENELRRRLSVDSLVVDPMKVAYGLQRCAYCCRRTTAKSMSTLDGRR